MDATWTNNEPDLGGNTPIRRLGDILNYGKCYTLSQVGVREHVRHHQQRARRRKRWHLFQAFGDPTLEMWTESPHHFMMPAVYRVSLFPEARSIEVSYAAAGAKLTAFQDVDGELMPLGRVMLDARGQATMSTFEFDPLRPIVFAACRDDAVCVAPTARRRAGGSPEVPAAVVAGVAGRALPEQAPLAARRVMASQSAVDRVFSQTNDDTSHAARASAGPASEPPRGPRLHLNYDSYRARAFAFRRGSAASALCVFRRSRS